MQPAQKTMGVSSRSRERPYNIVTGESIDPELTWAPGGARVRTFSVQNTKIFDFVCTEYGYNRDRWNNYPIRM